MKHSSRTGKVLGIALATVVAGSVTLPAFAGLGGDAASVDADVAKMKGQARATPIAGYTMNVKMGETFTVHGPPTGGSLSSIQPLEVLGSTGVGNAAGSPWDLAASGQVDKYYLLKAGDSTPGIQLPGNKLVTVYDGANPNKVIFQGTIPGGPNDQAYSVAPDPLSGAIKLDMRPVAGP